MIKYVIVYGIDYSGFFKYYAQAFFNREKFEKFFEDRCRPSISVDKQVMRVFEDVSEKDAANLEEIAITATREKISADELKKRIIGSMTRSESIA